MKLLLSLFCLITIFSFSQNEWTKDDRNTIYQDYLSILSQNKELVSDLKNTIALCAMNTTCEKYTRKDFAAKIEIELKRIQEAQLSICAKNSGVDINVQQNQSEVIPVATTDNWTKDDKEKLAKDFNSYIAKYESLSDDQIESLSYCYIQETVANTNKNRYFEMIDVELRQHKETLITQCAKNKKINLANPVLKEADKAIITKEFLVGSWKTDQNFTISFNVNGTFIKTFKENFYTTRYMKIENDVVNGEWFLDEKGVLTLNETWIELEDQLLLKTKRWSHTESGKYQFMSNSKDYFKMEFIEGQYCCQESNRTSASMVQANRVK
jgi:hypothetical protein